METLTVLNTSAFPQSGVIRLTGLAGDSGRLVPYVVQNLTTLTLGHVPVYSWLWWRNVAHTMRQEIVGAWKAATR
jgi:hypothetical protein